MSNVLRRSAQNLKLRCMCRRMYPNTTTPVELYTTTETRQLPPAHEPFFGSVATYNPTGLYIGIQHGPYSLILNIVHPF